MNDESPPIYTAEKNTLVFWEEAKKNGLRPGQYNSVLMVRVSTPGDNKSSSDYWVEETYPKDFPHPMFGAMRRNEEMFRRFGPYIEKYKASGAAGIVAGTPIEAWPVVGRAQVAMLKHHGIHSVEALSNLHDGQIHAIGMEGRGLVQKAKDYLATAENTAAGMKAMEEKRQLEERLGSLEAKYLDLAEALADLPEDAKAQVKKAVSEKAKGRAKIAA